MKWAGKIAVLLIAAALAYYATVAWAPAGILVFLKFRGEAEYNVPIYTDLITEEDRKVPLPNPDFLYIATAFDLSEGPIRVSGQMPDSTYYSVAFYEMNTRNFYIRNDRETPEKEFSIVLSTENDFKPLPGTPHEWVKSPGSKGAILVRILITDPGRVPYLKEIQQSFKVEKHAW